MTSDKVASELGMLLKKYRIRAGLSLVEVASQVDFSSPELIVKIEKGLCWPPLNVLRKMFGLYDLTDDEMMPFLIPSIKN